MPGAAELCTAAAARGGSGLVSLSAPGLPPADPERDRAARRSRPAGSVLRRSRDIGRFGALVIGPGLGRDDDMLTATRECIGEAPVPVVVDGDALFAAVVERRRCRTAAPQPRAADGPHAARRRVRVTHRGPPRRRSHRVSPCRGDRVRCDRAAQGSDHRRRRSGRPGVARSIGEISASPPPGPATCSPGSIGAAARRRRRARAARPLPAPGSMPPPPSSALRGAARRRHRRADPAGDRGAAMSGPIRWAWAEIDLDAIAHNVTRAARTHRAVGAVGGGQGRRLRTRCRRCRPHRDVGAGAEGLCVALVEEGIELRRAGIDAPILILSEQPPESAAAHHRVSTHADRVPPRVPRCACGRTADRTAGPPQGRHGHAARRRPPACGRVDGRGDRPAAPGRSPRRCVHPPRRRRRGRPRLGRVHRPAAGEVRQGARAVAARSPSSTPPTRPRRCPVPMLGCRSSAPASRSTASRQVTASTICAVISDRRWRSSAAVSFVKQVRVGQPDLLRPSPSIRPGHDRRDDSRSATPTACRVGCPRSAVRC